MLKRLHLQNFTVFADADFEFGPGLNVLVGNNGTGKSHVLKVGYAVELLYAAMPRTWESDFSTKSGNMPLSLRISEQLEETFQPRGITKLVRRAISQNEQAEVLTSFGTDGHLEFSIAAQQSISTVSVVNPTLIGELIDGPVFIPAKEIISLMPAVVGVSEQYSNFLDLTYTRLARLLLAPPRKKQPGYVIPILQKLENSLYGTIKSEDGRFYLIDEKGVSFGIGMVAEGLRKLGMLAHLLSNGSLVTGSTLYWDEPESNLNPALLRQLAAILAELARQGFQIILATHSTDLLKEFHILSRQKDAKSLPIKYFGLNAEPGEATRIVATDNFEHLPDVVALEVELKQADELEEIFIREDREYYANNRGEQPGI